MSAVFIFEIKSVKKDKIFNFLNGGFFVMRSPVDMNFGVLSETYVRLLTSITSQFFSIHSKSYNLNVKKCLKLTALIKKKGGVVAAKLYVPNTTL